MFLCSLLSSCLFAYKILNHILPECKFTCFIPDYLDTANFKQIWHYLPSIPYLPYTVFE
jgi:hypothetical protein